MQVTHEQLKRQQLIMKALGFFHGIPDGVWGPQSISAKQAFEKDRRFLPGIPNNGLPFREGVALPAGITMRKDGLFHHPAIDATINLAATTAAPEPSAQALADKSGSHLPLVEAQQPVVQEQVKPVQHAKK